MTKSNIYFILILSILISCNTSTENIKTEYYGDSEKSIYKKTIEFKDFDSIYIHYKNQSIFKKGKQYKNGKKFGIWNLYDIDSDLREIREYFYIKNHPERNINRNWFLNKKGDTIAYNKENIIYNQKEFYSDTLGHRNTSYDKIMFLTKDTISISEFYLAYAHCASPLLRDFDSKIKVIVDNTNKLKNNFSNIDSIKLDTFQYAKIDTIHNANFGSYDLNKTAAFSGKFKTSGKKTIRGLMIEYTDQYIDKNGELAYAESQTYFEKEIYVKDKSE
ncbi:hypothetical protein F7644_12455 [Tenacibaculum finnmarkense genomovar ulcerans]|uniref:hypothetical protein n=1 Tax=Tenacibaculum finnmarkense TaxID=2781243 RepID=UPI00187BAF02|nr:hypothetical protein [Tenacibaculum finnmarkense]MBE7646792.1 hypothetical protein [Tenacibaculum finnmarkense genomovar ulcerans]